MKRNLKTGTRPPEDHEANAPVRGSRGLWPLWLCFFLLVVYPLSVGPAAWLHKRQPAARPAIEGFYKPMTLLMDYCPPVRDFFVWYVTTVWRVK
jgi:hypothetical protein